MLDMPRGRPARLRYTHSEFVVLAPGDHVVCAWTGARIPLDELRYWSAVRQEPYASAEASARAEAAARGAPLP